MNFLFQNRPFIGLVISTFLLFGSFAAANGKSTMQFEPTAEPKTAPEVAPVNEPEPEPKKRRFLENFNGEDRTLMMGGQLNFNFPHSSKMTWITNIYDGKFVMENRTQTGNLYYDQISWVRYEGEDTLSSTENAIISVSVEAMNEGLGAAGILVGSGAKGYYLMFGIDKEGRYHVFQKSRNKTMPIYSGADEIIRPGQANRIHQETRGEVIAFFVNDKELISVPFDQHRPKEIALATFGLGTYTFDDVEIIAGPPSGKSDLQYKLQHKLKRPLKFKTAPSTAF